jgi:ubiquinone biosynthesis accessory factor UbiJ
MTPSLIPAIFNHLLAAEPWAQRKLAAHAAKVACVDTGLLAIRLKVAADGMLETAPQDAMPNVTIRVKPVDLPLMAQHRERAFSYVKVDGDADFANAISQLVQGLRWEAEEDLARFVGDIAANRIVAGAKAAGGVAVATHRKVTENLAEYFLDENPMLMRPFAVQEFADAVTTLRNDLERLSKRVERLTKGALK